MNISIIGIDGNMRTVEISNAMEQHWKVPMNHAQTILDQINSGMYERWFKGKKDLVCMDFGANVGLVSLYMLPACKELYCIEPTPSHMNLLQELLDANKGETRVTTHRVALTEKEGEVIFTTSHATENKITSEGGYGNVKITVQGELLNWFIDDKIIDFCKVDIEGYEIFALTEEQLKLAYGSVKCFFVECHPSNNYGMDSCREELVSRFKNVGYDVEVIDYQTIVATCK